MSLPIITIGRSFGSGGRIIGEKIATLLNIPLYDKELVQITAEKSGFHATVVEQMQQNKPASLLYSLSGSVIEYPLQDQVYYAQAAVIRDLAKKGPCVIVGRCADSILEHEARIMKVFIHAPVSQRAARAKDEYKITSKKPLDYIKYVRKCDKKRKSYYEYFTHRPWGKAEHYDLCLNSAMGLDVVADIIVRAAKEFPEEIK